MRRRLWIWLTLIGTPLFVGTVVAVVWGWDLLIPLIQSRASATLGRPVTVAHLHLSPGRISRITVEGVVIGNPPGWEGEPFAKVPRLVLEVDAWSYLRHRELVVPLVVVEEPTVHATQNQAGTANYQLRLAGDSGSGARLGEINNGANGKPRLEVDAKALRPAQPITGRLVGGPYCCCGIRAVRPVDLRLKRSD